MFNSGDHNQQVYTHRYLFHVSHPLHREGIQTYGILMSEFHNSERNGVYAHNTVKEPDYLWWPFLIIGDAEDGPIEKDPLKYYDFWRIDTYAIPNNKWYVDNVARADFKSWVGYDPKDLYVFTKSDIPTRAIELFRIQHDTCWDYKGTNGVYHFRNTGRFRKYYE